jgi:hypothetical protein
MRSAAYPSYSLTDCVEIVSKIYQSYGDASFIDRSQIAEALGLSVGSVVTRVSSCSQYGLLEKQSKVGYKPSIIFRKIYKPISEMEKHEALLEAFITPALYQKIIDKYDGHHFPQGSAFSNILYREFSISDKVAQIAADIFLENAELISAIDENNILNVRGIEINENLENSDLEESNNPTKKKDEEIANEDHNLKSNKDFHKIEIPLTHKKKAVISIPIDLNSKDILIIKKQMEVFELYIETEEPN